MIQRTPHSAPIPSKDQVVRAPAASDGVGLALRHVFSRDTQMPDDWEKYLRRLDDLPRC